MTDPLSPAPFVFLLAFFGLWVGVNLFHFHGFPGMVASAVGAVLLVWLSRSWWRRALGGVKRPEKSFRDPSFGNRAERREAARRHRNK